MRQIAEVESPSSVADRSAQALNDELMKNGSEAASARFEQEVTEFCRTRSSGEVSKYLERLRETAPAVWEQGRGLLDKISVPLIPDVEATKHTDAGVALKAGKDYQRSDWSGFKTLDVNLENRSSKTQRFELKFENEHGYGGHTRTRFEVDIAPNAKVVWQVPLAHLATTSGHNWPPQTGLTQVTQRGWVDLHGISKVSLSAQDPDANRDLHVNEIKLAGPYQSERWIDKFGQSDHVQWKGKVRSESDLVEADKQEALDLEQQRPDNNLGQYLGTTQLEKQTATNFFRTQQIDGKWWLIDPEGNPFFSTGLNLVSNGTFVKARMDEQVRKAYSWLPEPDGAFPRCVDDIGISMYGCNLFRKWGEDVPSKFVDRAIDRARSWGFNTAGNWSDSEVERRMPYTNVGPETYKLNIPYINWRICDVFAADFESEAMKSAQKLTVRKDDPLLVGYFVENEIPWYVLADNVLASSNDQPAKREFIKQLKDKYNTIEALNKSWGTDAESFETLTTPPQAKETADSKTDIAKFRGEFAERYYAVWYKAIKAADPNHLVLGSRFADRCDEVIDACARNTDVVSFNCYSMSADRKEFDNYYKRARKPFLIGEFGFDSYDRGLQTAFVPVADQADRGRAYGVYLEGVAKMPYFVGAHYFQYIDEPITGRVPDRETAFNGFVSVTDIPYKDLVERAKISNRRVYDLHSKSE